MKIFGTLKQHRALWCGIGLLAAGWIGNSMAHDGHEHSASPNAVSDEVQAAFIAENNLSMEKMMAGMDEKPTGDIDRDFVVQMTAHHQGAIDMAVTMLKYGKNEQLKRMAQEIIVDQQQEIAAMRQAIGDPLPPSVSSPTQIPSVHP
ncbi:DUF305 domain-containing protein [Pseudomonas sp. NPDC088444]|uniref:DUF305 domain-containing protein n=1 Tax=Pseudomonas sp. NPDC088444 TaxID=3364456 RepID=UPI0038505FD7